MGIKVSTHSGDYGGGGECLFHGRIEAGEDRVVAVQQVDQLSRREREAAVERSDGAEMPRIRPVLDPTPAADR
jgi:hypothetical protein